MSSKENVEITTLLTKLYTLQEDVGAKSKTTDAEKEQKASTSGTATISMGQNRAAKQQGSRFGKLKSSIIANLKKVHELLQEETNRTTGKTSVAQGNNPREIIAAQTEIRGVIRVLSSEWEQLNGIYMTEANKRKSRFTPNELEIQSALVTKLQEEITKVKAAQMKGYGRGGGNTDIATALNTKALADLDATPLFPIGSSGVGGGGGGGAWSSPNGNVTETVPLTDNQNMQIQQLQERDVDFDNQLDTIGEGITDLAEIAAMQGEEVKRQNVMLDNLGNRIDAAHSHVTNVNVKMKETLKEVGRSSDKICVDVMCIVLMIGFAAVIYKIFRTI